MRVTLTSGVCANTNTVINFYNESGIVTELMVNGTTDVAVLRDDGYYMTSHYDYANIKDVGEKAKHYEHIEGFGDLNVRIGAVSGFLVEGEKFRKARSLNFTKGDVFIYKEEIFVPYDLCKVDDLGLVEIAPFGGYEKITRHLYNFNCKITTNIIINEYADTYNGDHKDVKLKRDGSFVHTQSIFDYVKLNNKTYISGCYADMIENGGRLAANEIADDFNRLTHSSVFYYGNIQRILQEYDIIKKK